MPLTCKQFAYGVKVEIYKRIQSEQEGKMEEVDFNDQVCRYLEEEINDEINIMYLDEVERLLCEYGIAAAISFYISEFGAITKEISEKMLLCTIINDYLNDKLTHDDYLKWCKE